MEASQDLTSTAQIREWRSIVTLVVFVLANINVLFPFSIPIYIPSRVSTLVLDLLAALRIIRPPHGRLPHTTCTPSPKDDDRTDRGNPGPGRRRFARLEFPINFVTAPLIADLFLLAISAIGRTEVHDGTLGADHISPIDIMAFFITLAYIAISIDASGLIRYLAFKVLQLGGQAGRRLFLLLYVFFFLLGSFIGNDPIILSGTAFLAYMTRVSSNIAHPRAWIHSQFAVANIASAILVSSNPTNLVLAGAFEVKFIHYTANMIVPVVVTATLLFPYLLFVVFRHESLIPRSIEMHTLSREAMSRKPVNPHIPFARAPDQDVGHLSDSKSEALSLEEIMNPFLDKKGAAFGTVIMAVTLITVLALNASGSKAGQHPVFWVTLPAAVVMLSWDVLSGWLHRKESREVAAEGRRQRDAARAGGPLKPEASPTKQIITTSVNENMEMQVLKVDEKHRAIATSSPAADESASTSDHDRRMFRDRREPEHEQTGPYRAARQRAEGPTTLISLVQDALQWSKETFPTATAVLLSLPFALVPFAFCMFVLVQGLVAKGWVAVFAHGWDAWVARTGTVGAVGGMGFLSVVLSNFAGTNIGTTILLSRVVQSWVAIHQRRGTFISERNFWATVYSMALGVNFGAFSAALSASLAGLLWRDILGRKHIHVSSWTFARVNFPVISAAMVVACAVMIGEVYLTRGDGPYLPPGLT